MALGFSIASGGCITNNQTPSSGPGGSPPPWRVEDSPMDIGVENRMDSTIEATVKVDTYRKQFMVNPGSTWVSGNIIESGSTPSVNLTVDSSRDKMVTWDSEEENELYLLFFVGPEEITHQMREKGTINRTQVTDMERS